jgi:hypothetical protein
MKTVQKACIPRKNILKKSEQSYALNLTDFSKGLVEPTDFFDENYITEGMDQLIRIAFDRFQRKSDTALIKLTQAMGGGKTHNMITLGLLAKHPEFRGRVQESGIKIDYKNPVRVIGFSGRESDVQAGIWGELARQLGKFEEFSPYYSGQLQAPGETAWINLLQSDEPLLILLDELPPYYENAKSRQIGNSDLSVVTTTAMANLFSAVTKKELGNVLVVISDLKATYEGGSGALIQSLSNLENETNRISIDLAPVKSNSNEVFRILRKKLFESVGDEAHIDEIAEAYSSEIRKAKGMELTIASPEDFRTETKTTYPFHPSIKDLYYRFKENPGFQQTRGLIRLMRTLVLSLYSEQRKEEPVYLLSPQNFDFNDSQTFNILNQINSTLGNAISHDIAANNQALAEQLDSVSKTSIHSDIAKIVYFSSLANVPNAVRGLGESDIVQYAVRPGEDIGNIRQNVLPALRSHCWYMHLDRDGKYLFKDTQNIVAKLNSLTSGYDSDVPRREIERQLKEMFQIRDGDVYQSLSIFTPWQDIALSYDKVNLIIKKPMSSAGIPKEIEDFYSEQTYKNRLLVLTGEIVGMDALNTSAKNIKAIEHVIGEFQKDKVPESDIQFKEALSLKDTYYQNFFSACRETFTKLIYPTKDKLYSTDISMLFSQNKYDAEEQIRKALESKQKFTSEVDSDTFRQKMEQRLFASQEMEWNEVKKRAGMNPTWQWHRMDALDRMKQKLVGSQIWRENGKFINKGPHPKENTSVIPTILSRDDSTGVVVLNVKELNGDVVYYDYGSDPTPQSKKVSDKSRFETGELEVRFLCVDSTGQHPTGSVVVWRNSILVKHDVVTQNNTTSVILKAIPKGIIRYTTDGSDPKEYGGSYTDPFVIDKKCRVLAIAEMDGIVSDILSFDIEPGEKDGIHIDPVKPLTWSRKLKLDSTHEVYTHIRIFEKFQASILGFTATVISEENRQEYINIKVSQTVIYSPSELSEFLDSIRRKWNSEVKVLVSLSIDSLKFVNGQDFLHTVEELKLDYQPGEVRQ